MSASKFFRNFLTFLPPMKSKDNNCHQTREKGHENYDTNMQKTQGERFHTPDVGCTREFQEIIDQNSHNHKIVSEDSPTTDLNETLNQALHLNLQLTGKATTVDIEKNLCGTEENERKGVDTVTSNGPSRSSGIETEIKNDSTDECGQNSSPNTEIHANGVCPIGFNTSPPANADGSVKDDMTEEDVMTPQTNADGSVKDDITEGDVMTPQTNADGSVKDDMTEKDVMAPTSIFDKVFQDHVNKLHIAPKTNDLEESHRSSCLNAEQQVLHLNGPLVNTDLVDVELSTGRQSEKIDDVLIKIGSRPVATYDDECISISSSDTEILEEADYQGIEMEEEEAHEDMEMHEEETGTVVVTRDVINVSASRDVRSQSQSRVKSNSTQEKTSKDNALSSNSYVVQRLSDNSGGVETSNLAFQLVDSPTQEALSVTTKSDRSAAANSFSLLYSKSLSTSNVTIMSANIAKAHSNQTERNDDSSNVVKKMRISVAASVAYEKKVLSLAGSQLSTMTQTLVTSIQPFGINNPGTPTSVLILPSIQPFGITNPGTPTSILSLPSIQPNGISNPGTPTSVLILPSIQPFGISNPGAPTSFLSLPSIQPSVISNPGTSTSFFRLPSIQPYGINNPGAPTSILSLPSIQPYCINNPATPTSILSLRSIQPNGISNPGTYTSFLSLPSIQPYDISKPGTPTSILSLRSIQPNGISNPGAPTSILSLPSIQPNGISNPGAPTSILSLPSIQPNGISNPGAPTSILSLPSIQPNGISNPGAPTSILSLPSIQPNGISNPGAPTSILSLPSIQPNGISNPGTSTSFLRLPSIQPYGINNPRTSTSFLSPVHPFALSKLPPGSTVVINRGSFATKDKEQYHLSQPVRSAGSSQEESFSCFRCSLRFRTKSDLCHHKCTHREERQFSCIICKKSFRTREDLIVHSNHPEDCREDVLCNICKKVFRISSSLKRLFTFLSSEKSVSNEGDTEVNSPGSSSISKPSSLSNRLEMAKDAPAPFYDLTDDDCRTSSAYCSHIESTISSKVPPGSTLFNLRGLFRIKDKESPFGCGYCGKAYKLKYSLYGHVKLQHDEKCFSCEFCGKRYAHERELLTHVTMHTQEKPFTCDQCGMRFRLHGTLRRHKLTHSEERLYPCNKCDKSFKTCKVLSKHKEIHNEDGRIECSICKRTFSAATNLKEHMRIHTGEKPFKCTLCEKQFRLKPQLQIHLGSHSGKKRLTVLSLPSIQPYGINNPRTSTSFLSLVHPFARSKLPPGSTVVINRGSFATKDKEQYHLSQPVRSAGPSQEESFSCFHCSLRFRTKSDLCHHKCTHREERQFSCIICKKSFRTREDLIVHSNHPEDCREDVLCNICKKVFRISSSLKRLFTFLSSEKSVSNEGDTEVNSPGSSSISKPSPLSNRLEMAKDAPAPFYDLTDDDDCRTSSAYCSHIESTISSKVPPGSTLFNLRGLFRIKDKESPFGCGYCGKTYKLKHSLYGHVKLQHDEKCFSCEFCGKRYAHERELLTHVTMHTHEKPFTCDQCGMRFRLVGTLRRHKLTHSEERLYPCNKCNKSFKTSQVLSRHKDIHDKDGRRECSICKRTFSAATNLKEHMRIHTGEKPFKCTLCEKQFRLKPQLQIHMGSHSGKKRLAKNPCSVCGKNVWNNYMPTHIRMHSGEKPFECSICGKRFPKKMNLEGHMRSHTGEKPFACSGCDKRFALYSNMMTHKAKCTTLSGNIA